MLVMRHDESIPRSLNCRSCSSMGISVGLLSSTFSVWRAWARTSDEQGDEPLDLMDWLRTLTGWAPLS